MRRVVDEEGGGRGEGGQVYLVAPVVSVVEDQDDDWQDALPASVEYQLDDALLPRIHGRGCAATSVRG